MDDISDVLERLTHNHTYATDICLLLYLEEKYTSLYYLDYLWCSVQKKHSIEI